jgi:hypothetical protein
MTPTRRLIFVYNADSGFFNMLSDVARKLLSPETYHCKLCALTYSPFAIRTEWRGFLAGLATECRFLHRDEFAHEYPLMEIALPAVLCESDAGVTLCVEAATLEKCDSLEGLKGLITTRCLLSLP